MRVFTPLLSFFRLFCFLVMVWSVMVSVRGDPSFLTQPVTVSALAETSDGPAPVYQCLKDVVAISKTAPATPAGFALISAGTFQMGDSFGEGDAGERPLRQVTVSAFYMAERETTKALWDEVRAWGVSHGYTDLAVGGGKASHHPVQNVTWFDVVKWCNARSEKEGLVPCYTVGGTPMRTGTAIPVVHWTAKGYRLPTEAEWEKAARGGLKEKRFPWGDTITHSQVNYQSNEEFAPDISPMRGFHPTYDIGDFPYTSPVGSFKANEYGLYDMTGNVWEWCWDWYGTYPSGAPTDPQGSALGLVRVQRGGSWGNYAYFCRVSTRDRCNPFLSDYALGFRVVLFADASARAAPIVTTGVAVAGDGAGVFTVSGSVISEGGSPVTARGVVYGLVPEPTTTSAMTSPSGTDTGDFSSTLANLVLDTIYYARAYATNEVGTRYGAEITFKTASASPVGFSLIPAGTFQMGDWFGEGDAGERPLRQVTVSAFYMAQWETTKSLWDEVRAWAVSRGYTDLPVGGGKADTHPVHWITWFDVIKWCNARSEKDGLTPCYTVVGSPLRTGTAIPVVNWKGNGYRLPTEAEWEKAARGGLNGKRFPWGDTIDHCLANYNSSSTETYDISPTLGLHPTYAVGSWPNTSPVGSFAANGYGLYDMMGNIYEWCWDWYGRYAPTVPTDPQGNSLGTSRVMRGGSFYYSGNYGRAGCRNRSNPVEPNYDVGFRMVRGQ
jgi:formylglycine-generating enzyme required for sulfatase activity